mgnify:CR=1 FL=1
MSGWIAGAMVVGGLAQAAAGYDWGGKRRKALEESRRRYNIQKGIYQKMEITNPYENLQNRFAELENTAEDLTVNRQQAQFQRQLVQQQQANIMQGLKGAAGGSGVAGLAQAMAIQGATQAQKASASIGLQEEQNRKMAMQQAAQIQQLEAQGASALDTRIALGEQERQSAEMSRQATILGMDASMVTGAQSAVMAGQQQVGEGLSTAAEGYAQYRKG